MFRYFWDPNDRPWRDEQQYDPSDAAMGMEYCRRCMPGHDLVHEVGEVSTTYRYSQGVEGLRDKHCEDRRRLVDVTMGLGASKTQNKQDYEEVELEFEEVSGDVAMAEGEETMGVHGFVRTEW
jgi:hypothetical protein